MRPDAPTATLNHLRGGGPVTEWVSLTHEQAELLEKLRRVTTARAQLELHLLLAGVDRAQLDAALTEAGTR